jgi:predicted HTH domain antitoxin
MINCKRGLAVDKTVAARIPVELEEEIGRFMDEEGLDKSTALRRVLEIGVGEWKRRRAVELYRSGKVTLWKASQMWGVSLREMLDELDRLRVIAHVAAKDIEEDIEAARAAEAQAGTGTQRGT